MPAVTPEDRVTQSEHELHVSLDLPRASARQIYLWAQNQPWPEGTELEKPGDYHITLLCTPEGHEQFKDAHWLEHMDQAEVKITGISAFASQEQGYAYVLRVESEEVQQKAEEMQGRAEWAGLPITKFPGGYKAHITVGYGPSSRLTGVHAPNFQFDVGPSSVSPPRIKESAAEDPEYFYHLAPTEERERIQTHGLYPSLPMYSPRWASGYIECPACEGAGETEEHVCPECGGSGEIDLEEHPEMSEVGDQPKGLYVYGDHPGGHTLTGENMDLWRIPRSQVRDYYLEQHQYDESPRYVIPHHVPQPELYTPFEATQEYQQNYGPYGPAPPETPYWGWLGEDEAEDWGVGKPTHQGRAHLAFGPSFPRTSEYNGWSNWDSWNTKLMMDNERHHYDAMHGIVERGGGPEELRQHFEPNLIGPYNNERLQEAQDWNAIDPDERRRMIDQRDRAEFGDAAVDMGRGLMDAGGFGNDPGKDDTAELIDPHMVNWDEIHHNILSEYDDDHPLNQQYQNPAPLTFPQEWTSRSAAMDDYGNELSWWETAKWGELLNSQQIAEHYGLVPSAISNYQTRYQDFPKSILPEGQQWGKLKLFPANEVHEWFKRRGQGRTAPLNMALSEPDPRWMGPVTEPSLQEPEPPGQEQPWTGYKRGDPNDIEENPPRGSRLASKAPEPPNYRHHEKPGEKCSTCKMFDHEQKLCWGFGNKKVSPEAVCDDFYPEHKRSAYSPDEVKVLDHLSLTNVAANIHYKFAEGGLDPQAATDYAKRMLKLIGYPPDDITVQAALQAWQQLYPDDRIEDNSQPANNQLNAPTVPTKSWGYGTKTAAPTQAQLLRHKQQLEHDHGPDQSEVKHQWPDGWTLRQLQTYGDAYREGQLMRNCLSPSISDSPHGLWTYHPQAPPLLDEGYSENYDYKLRQAFDPHRWDLSLPLRGFNGGIYSLRDPENIPHVTADHSEFGMGTDNPELGRNNSDPKPEYMDRIADWWTQEHGQPFPDPWWRQGRWGYGTHSKTTPAPTHYNRWTGLPCNCPWHYQDRRFRSSAARLAGQHINKIMKAPDKVYKTPEGEAFRQQLAKDLGEEHDALAPYLAQRWKKGEVRLGVDHPTRLEPRLWTQSYGDHRYDLDPGWNEGINMPKSGYWRMLSPTPMSPGPLARWSQWYNARQHPTRRGVNVMDPNFTVHDIDAKANEHQRALDEERQLHDMNRLGETVHTFPAQPGGGIDWDDAFDSLDHGRYDRSYEDAFHHLMRNEAYPDPYHSDEMEELDRDFAERHFPTDHDYEEQLAQHQHDQQNRREDLVNAHEMVKNNHSIPARQAGWHIKQLTADPSEAREALEHEGCMMGHCIGSDEQPYKNLAEKGKIDAYSLRDPKGRPHVTWHYNNSDGSLAEIFGPNDDPVKPEYQQMLDEWGRNTGMDTDRQSAVGNQEAAGIPEWHAEDPETMDDYLNQYGDNADLWGMATESGEDVDEHTQAYPGEPQWHDIAQNMMGYGHTWNPASGTTWGTDPYAAANTDQVRQMYDAARVEQHLPSLHNALEEYEVTHPNQQAVMDQWNRLVQPHYHPQTGQFTNEPVLHQFQQPLPGLQPGGTFSAVPNDPRLTLYHGTTNRALDLARQRGGLHTWSPRDVAYEVAGHYGLDPEEFYNHPYFEFSRGNRTDDPYIYLTTDKRTAQSYANARSEQLEDALGTAHRMLHPQMYEGLNPDPNLNEHRRAFKDDYHNQRNIQPQVVRASVPLSAIPQDQLTSAQMVIEHPPSHDTSPFHTTFTLPAPVPLDWISPEKMSGVSEKFAYSSGELCYSKSQGFGYIARETLPQEQRRWEGISAPAVHTFPDNWAVHQIANEADMHSVGRFMRNCWQGGMSNQDWIDRKAGYGVRPYSLHDENGLPRAAFWMDHEGSGTPIALFGMRNQPPPTGTYKRLYTDWLGKPTPFETWQQEQQDGPIRGTIGEPRAAALTTPQLYHWLDASQIHDWMDESHTGPGQTFLTETGDDPHNKWNPDVPQFDNPVRLTIDPHQLDPNGFDQAYEGWLQNHLYTGVIPQSAITDIKSFKRPDEWDEQFSTVPSQVNNPEDHWRDGTDPSKRVHDIQFSNDFNWHQGATMAAMPGITEDQFYEQYNPQEHDFDPNWSYQVRFDQFGHPLHQLAQTHLNELAARGDTPFERGHVVPANLSANANPSGQDAAGVYASGTYNEPVIMIDLDAHRDPDVISPEDEVRRTIDHETAHAIQEWGWDGGDQDWANEDEAEGHRFK